MKDTIAEYALQSARGPGSDETRGPSCDADTRVRERSSEPGHSYDRKDHGRRRHPPDPARPAFDRRARARARDQVLASDVLALGPFARAFEEACAALAGRRFGVSCTSGTAGLHLGVRALGIGEGDEVITTPFSFVASANCLLYERAVPRFVDIEEDTLGLDPDLVERPRRPRTTGGPAGPRVRPAVPDRGDRRRSAERRGWPLIEDACEGLGSSVGGTARSGSFGDASVFAFYPNKQITTGEGGMVVTDDPALATTMRSLRNQGRDEDGTWLRHVRLGYNYRLDELSAAVGVAQLERLAELAGGPRPGGRARTSGRSAGATGSGCPQRAPSEAVDWFVYVVRLDPRDRPRPRSWRGSAARGRASRGRTSARSTSSRSTARRSGYAPGDFPVTERVAASTLALPFSAVLPDEDVAYVAAGPDRGRGGRRPGPEGAGRRTGSVRGRTCSSFRAVKSAGSTRQVCPTGLG